MRKGSKIFVVIICTAILSACSREQKEEIILDTVASSSLQEISTADDTDSTDMPGNDVEVTEDASDNNIVTESENRTIHDDVDLTELSSTMVYAEVVNMIIDPEQYVGVMVKMQGQFAMYENPDNGSRHYACIIADATACCSQGIEFVLGGDYIYPDDYPQKGDEITVQGRFEIYEENGNDYIHLVDAQLQK